MARKQTRRSISVSGPTYWKLKEHCESRGTTMSGTVEMLIRNFFSGVEVEVKEPEPVSVEVEVEVKPDPPTHPKDMERGALIRFAAQREAEKRREREREALAEKERREAERAKALADSDGIFTF